MSMLEGKGTKATKTNQGNRSESLLDLRRSDACQMKSPYDGWIMSGDARRIIQYNHRMRLFEWLDFQIRSGIPIDHIRFQLAI